MQWRSPLTRPSIPTAIAPYGTDFDPGQSVKVVSKKWGVTLATRITEIEESYDSTGQSLDITFGKGVLTLAPCTKTGRVIRWRKSGFFNSTSGDRMYDASDFAGYFSKLLSNGIFYTNADNLRVTPGGGLSVNILAGSAWINGYAYENTEELNLTLAAADGVESPH